MPQQPLLAGVSRERQAVPVECLPILVKGRGKERVVLLTTQAVPLRHPLRWVEPIHCQRLAVDVNSTTAGASVDGNSAVS